MFCAHFLFKFASFFVCLFQFILLHFLTLFVICLCIFRSFTSFSRVSHLHIIVYMQGCIYVDPIYHLHFMIYQCSVHYVFAISLYYLCSLAMIAFNFKVLRIAFHIKPLSASNWGTRPHKMHGIFHDVTDTCHYKRVISFKGPV
jgi:hypothetical protein